MQTSAKLTSEFSKEVLLLLMRIELHNKSTAHQKVEEKTQ